MAAVPEEDGFSSAAGCDAGQQDLHERVVEQGRSSVDDARELGRLGDRTALQGDVFSDETDHRGGEIRGAVLRSGLALFLSGQKPEV